MPRWTHKDRTARNRKGRFHVVDPTYHSNGLPAVWTCHVCNGLVLLGGKTVPITVQATTRTPRSPARDSK